MGRSINVFVRTELERQAPHNIQEAFERAVLKEPGVADCYEISGNYDFMTLVHSSDMAAYHAFTRRVLTGENHVRNFNSQFVMNFTKVENKIVL